MRREGATGHSSGAQAVRLPTLALPKRIFDGFRLSFDLIFGGIARPRVRGQCARLRCSSGRLGLFRLLLCACACRACRSSRRSCVCA